MTKRSFFLTIAAGLLASVAFATPSQAATEYLLTASFAVTPTDVTATDITITLNGAVPASGYTTLSSGGIAGGVTASGSGSVIELSFAAANATTSNIEISFSGPAGLLISGITSPSLSGLSSDGISGTGLNVNISSVPEPTSMALLGIGMTGFLAFRRFFKRMPVA